MRDIGTGEPVTPETLFHLASVSKPFVATALATTGVDLDAPATRWVPEFSLADGRADEITLRHLMSHTSGLPDVDEYGWHEPKLGDGALSEFVVSLAPWRLQGDPGAAFAYSNAGYELLGLVLARVAGTSFEEAMRGVVLDPLGMRSSTFTRAHVPQDRAAAPHVGLPLVVPGAAYPYTRQHAPSSSLHSSLTDLVRFVQAQLVPGPDSGLDPGAVEHLRRPVAEAGEPPWNEATGSGWALGSYGGHRTVGHSGLDPGFGARVTLVPEQRLGVVVLYNSNTVFASAITKAALEAILGVEPAEGSAVLGSARRPLAGPLADVLADAGPEAAAAEYRNLLAAEPALVDLEEDGFEDATWGAIELHRTDLAWPLLRLWTTVRPEDSSAWAMTGWAHQVDGELTLARTALQHALDLDPGNVEAARRLAALTTDTSPRP